MSHDYLYRMLDMLTGAYNRSDMDAAKRDEPLTTNIGRLFVLLAYGLEQSHDTLDTIRLWDDIDYAQGSTLDRWGLNFGVARDGMQDNLYRLFIRVKILAQLSGGDIDTVINAAATLFGIEPDKVVFDEIYPAKMRITIEESDLDEEHRAIVQPVTRFMKRIVAAGIWFDVLCYMRRIANAEVYIGAYALCIDRVTTQLPGVSHTPSVIYHAGIPAYYQKDITREQEAQP